jgi:hypothetical protein
VLQVAQPERKGEKIWISVKPLILDRLSPAAKGQRRPAPNGASVFFSRHQGIPFPQKTPHCKLEAVDSHLFLDCC